MTQQLDDATGLPPALKEDATDADVVRAINGLAIEVQLVRVMVRDIGSSVGRVLDTLQGMAKVIGEQQALLRQLTENQALTAKALQAVIVKP